MLPLLSRLLLAVPIVGLTFMPVLRFRVKWTQWVVLVGFLVVLAWSANGWQGVLYVLSLIVMPTGIRGGVCHLAKRYPVRSTLALKRAVTGD